MVAEQLGQPVALEHAQHRRRQRLDRMLHRPDHRALQPDEVARQAVIENLPPSVFQRLEAEGPAAEQGEELRAMGAFGQDHRAGLGHQLAALEAGDETQFFRREGPELGHCTQGALLAGNSSR